MSRIVRFPNEIPAKQGMPWLLMGVLTVAFFIALHDPMRSYSIEDDYLPSEETLQKNASEGNAKRQVGFLMVGAMGVAVMIGAKRRTLDMNGFLAKLICFFMVWISISILWADEPMLTGRRLIVIALLAIGALAVASQMSLRDVVLFVLLSSLAYLFVGLMAELALGTFRPWVERYRFSGTIHPNNQGVNCSLIILAGVTAWMTEKRFRWFYGSAVALAFAVLLMTKSRTSLLSLLVALGAYFVIVHGGKKGLLHIGFLGLTALFAVLVFANEYIVQAFGDMILLGRTDQDISGAMSLTGRLPLWQQLLEYAAERPIQGYGYGSFFTLEHIAAISKRQGWPIAECHSVFLEVLMGLGLVGLISYALIQILGLARSVKYARASNDPRYAFIGALLLLGIVGGMAESTLLVPTMQTFVQFVSLSILAFQVPPDAVRLQSAQRDHGRFSAPPVHSLAHLTRPTTRGSKA